jgi:hypothetical protein
MSHNFCCAAPPRTSSHPHIRVTLQTAAHLVGKVQYVYVKRMVSLTARCELLGTRSKNLKELMDHTFQRRHEKRGKVAGSLYLRWTIKADEETRSHVILTARL